MTAITLEEKFETKLPDGVRETYEVISGRVPYDAKTESEQAFEDLIGGLSFSSALKLVFFGGKRKVTRQLEEVVGGAKEYARIGLQELGEIEDPITYMHAASAYFVEGFREAYRNNSYLQNTFGRASEGAFARLITSELHSMFYDRNSRNFVGLLEKAGVDLGSLVKISGNRATVHRLDDYRPRTETKQVA